MRNSFVALAAAVGVLFLLGGCSTAPKTSEERESLRSEASAATKAMTAKDRSLSRVLDRSVGYVVFPNVGKGGAIAGGAYGRGVLYEQGRPNGFVELNQASIGAPAGGQNY